MVHETVIRYTESTNITDTSPSLHDVTPRIILCGTDSEHYSRGEPRRDVFPPVTPWQCDRYTVTHLYSHSDITDACPPGSCPGIYYRGTHCVTIVRHLPGTGIVSQTFTCRTFDPGVVLKLPAEWIEYNRSLQILLRPHGDSHYSHNLPLFFS